MPCSNSTSAGASPCARAGAARRTPSRAIARAQSLRSVSCRRWITGWARWRRGDRRGGDRRSQRCCVRRHGAHRARGLRRAASREGSDGRCRRRRGRRLGSARSARSARRARRADWRRRGRRAFADGRRRHDRHARRCARRRFMPPRRIRAQPRDARADEDEHAQPQTQPGRDRHRRSRGIRGFRAARHRCVRRHDHGDGARGGARAPLRGRGRWRELRRGGEPLDATEGGDARLALERIERAREVGDGREASLDGLRQTARHDRVERLGASGRCARRLAGGSAAIAERMAPAVSPAKGTCAVRSSWRMTPSAQISVRASTFFALRICSGDMYAGDPKTE